MAWTRLMHTRNAPIIELDGKLYRLDRARWRLTGLHDPTDVRELNGKPIDTADDHRETSDSLIGSTAHLTRPLHRHTQKRPATHDGGPEGEP